MWGRWPHYSLMGMALPHRAASDSGLFTVAAMAASVAVLFGAVKYLSHLHYERYDQRLREEAAEQKFLLQERNAQQDRMRDKARQEIVTNGMRVLDSGALEEIDTGLEWTPNDNGFDISKNDALTYCQKLTFGGGGWSLPTAQQLEHLHDPTASEINQCGGTACRVSILFSLSAPFLWSADEAEPESAWYVSMKSGQRFSESVRVPPAYRALCVRNKKRAP